MENKDIRWIQRFSNFKKALAKLSSVVEEATLDELSELETEGLIQRFEYTFELAWKTLQDLLQHKGYESILGPNPVLNQALKDGYITDAEKWRTMKKSRELTSHTYNSGTAKEIADGIFDTYHDLLKNLETRLEQEESGQQPNVFDE
jgi:nucleotidyltransferase substrate binding protein (TIGR01987 family)